MKASRARSQETRRPPKAAGALAMVLYVIGTLVVIGVIGTLVPSVSVRTVPYSDFKQMLRANEIAAVVVSEPRIRGTLKKSDETILTIRVDDESLIEELEQHGVKVTGEI